MTGLQGERKLYLKVKRFFAIKHVYCRPFSRNFAVFSQFIVIFTVSYNYIAINLKR